MEKIALLNLKQEPGNKWTWTAYDQQGSKLGSQENLGSIEEAFTEVLKWVDPVTYAQAVRHTESRRKSAKKSPGPRTARK